MTGLGAQRWITLGPLEIQPSELMKISLVLALARFLHGQSVEEVSRPLRLAIPLAMIAMPAGLVVIQPNLGTTLIMVADGVRCYFWPGCPGGGFCRPSAPPPPRCRWPGNLCCTITRRRGC